MANEQSHTVSNSGCDYLEVGFSQYHHTPPRMITLEEFTNSVKVGNGTEVFTSAYRYVSTDPYSGPITSNFYLDFDFEKDPDLARREALKVARWFNDIGIPEVGIRIVFSGCKGFWIFISKHFFNASPREDLPEVWERLARILKEYFKLTTLDFQPYFRRAMIRVNSSIHSRTGLYRIPISFAELSTLTMEQIKEFAKAPRFLEYPPTSLLQPIEKIERIYQRCVEMVEHDKARLKQAIPVKSVKTIEKLPAWVRKRLDEPVGKGIRNLTIFQLSTAMAQFGIEKDLALSTIIDYASRCNPSVDRNEATRTIESAYQGVEQGKYSVSPQSDAFREFADLTSSISLEAEERANSIMKDGNILQSFIEDTNRSIVRDERVRRNLIRIFSSAYTEDPSNYGLPGPPGIGKSFIPINISKFLPEEQVWIIGGLSPTALIHERGEQVDEFTYRVDLSGKIMIFTEPPEAETLDKLLPILSHDAEQISYKFTDKTSDGRLATMTALIQGWPAVILCGTLSNLPAALATRFIVDQPEISLSKVEDAIAQQASIAEEPDALRESDNQTTMVWKAVFYELWSQTKQNGKFKVKIPYAKVLAKHYSKSGPSDMRFFRHLLRVIKANSVIQYQQRKKDSDGYLIASAKDFIEVLSDFKPLVAPSRRGIALDTAMIYEQLTKSQMEQFRFEDIYNVAKSVLGVQISPTTTRDLHIKGLVGCGLLEEAVDPKDSRRKVYTTTEPLTAELFDDEEQTIKDVSEQCGKCSESRQQTDDSTRKPDNVSPNQGTNTANIPEEEMSKIQQTFKESRCNSGDIPDNGLISEAANSPYASMDHLIIEVIKSSPGVSLRELSSKIGLSDRTTSRRMKHLIDDLGKVESRLGQRGGYFLTCPAKLSTQP